MTDAERRLPRPAAYPVTCDARVQGTLQDQQCFERVSVANLDDLWIACRHRLLWAVGARGLRFGGTKPDVAAHATEFGTTGSDLRSRGSSRLKVDPH